MLNMCKFSIYTQSVYGAEWKITKKLYYCCMFYSCNWRFAYFARRV